MPFPVTIPFFEEKAEPLEFQDYVDLFQQVYARDDQLQLQITTALSNRCAVLYETAAPGVNGGTFTSGAWRVRTLNAFRDQMGLIGAGITFPTAANRFALEAGDWFVHVRAPAYRVDEHSAALYAVGAASYIVGSNQHAYTGDQASTDSTVWAPLRLVAPEEYEVHHICATTQATNGFGVAQPGGLPTKPEEVYTEVFICRVS